MTDTDLQGRVAAFLAEHDLSVSVEHRVLDVVAEVGEFSKEVLEATDYGDTGFEHRDELVDEYGDVLFSLLCIADNLGIDADQAVEQALDKYRERIDATDNPDSGGS